MHAAWLALTAHSGKGEDDGRSEDAEDDDDDEQFDKGEARFRGSSPDFRASYVTDDAQTCGDTAFLRASLPVYLSGKKPVGPLPRHDAFWRRAIIPR